MQEKTFFSSQMKIKITKMNILFLPKIYTLINLYKIKASMKGNLKNQ